jgi:hypothetical protein
LRSPPPAHLPIGPIQYSRAFGIPFDHSIGGFPPNGSVKFIKLKLMFINNLIELRGLYFLLFWHFFM